MVKMHAMYEQLGIIGAIVSGVAYLPQITHMIRGRCTYGLSLSAFMLWLIAAVLITIHAIAIAASAFILLGVIQITASFIIVAYCLSHQGEYCTFHAKPLKHRR